MITLHEGEKRDIIAYVRRLRGSGAITVQTPQRRILDSAKALITGYDWATATWDSGAAELYCLFDSTLTGLTAVGTYYVQLRGIIGTERYEKTITVRILESGP